MSKEKKLEYSNFNTYPHYVYATAFLVNGELADYKIQDRERCWGERTFRGSAWENEVWQHGFIDKDWDLTCKYNKILVNNNKEHNNAFELLEMWLDNSFKKYKNISMNFIYEKVNEKTEGDTIDIQSIEETDVDIAKHWSLETRVLDNTIQINKILQWAKQHDKEIKELKEK